MGDIVSVSTEMEVYLSLNGNELHTAEEAAHLFAIGSHERQTRCRTGAYKMNR